MQNTSLSRERRDGPDAVVVVRLPLDVTNPGHEVLARTESIRVVLSMRKLVYLKAGGGEACCCSVGRDSRVAECHHQLVLGAQVA